MLNDNIDKVYGIVGGLGAEASAKLYLDIVNDTMAKCNIRYPAIALWNIPITKEKDEDLMRYPQDEDGVALNLLKDGIERLIKAGANVIGIACNTIHFLIHHLPNYDVKLLNIVDCTVSKIDKMGIKKVGLLATNSSVNSGLYANPLKAKGVEVVLPSEEEQIALMKVIFSQLEGKEMPSLKAELKRIIREMKTDTVILGCTELPIIIKQSDMEDVILIDSLCALKEEMMDYKING